MTHVPEILTPVALELVIVHDVRLSMEDRGELVTADLNAKGAWGDAGRLAAWARIRSIAFFAPWAAPERLAAWGASGIVDGPRMPGAVPSLRPHIASSTVCSEADDVRRIEPRGRMSR